jgi:hypothetical protein
MPPAPAAPPTVLCLLLAECIHVSADRRANILGVFNGYTAPAFPATLPRTWLYLALTDGYGAAALTLRLLDADESRPPLFEEVLPPARFASPLEVKEVVMEVPAIPLPGPGVYRWQVLCEGEVLHERRLVVQSSDD